MGACLTSQGITSVVVGNCGISASPVVPGDIVLLAAGNLIPADGVVIEARDFLVSQAALTGFRSRASPSSSRARRSSLKAMRSRRSDWLRMLPRAFWRCASGRSWRASKSA